MSSVSNVEIPRVAGFTEADTAEAPVWWQSDDGTVLISCGGCGNYSTIKGWSIADDGTVTPSFFHNESYCGWHVFARLIDWQ
jgi:hypothetical protein